MARFSGVGLSVEIDAAPLPGATSVTENHSHNTTDVTGADSSGFRAFVLNLLTGTFSVEGHDDSGAGAPGRSWVLTTKEFTITMGTSGPVLNGNAIITNMTFESAIEGAVDYNFDATWSGKPTYTE